jgi:hypothetical protein
MALSWTSLVFMIYHNNQEISITTLVFVFIILLNPQVILTESVLALCGTQPMISAVCEPKTTPVYILPRFTDQRYRSAIKWRKPIEAPWLFWSIHTANAFEERDNLGHVECWKL